MRSFTTGLIAIVVYVLCPAILLAADSTVIYSPDRHLKLVVHTEARISYQIQYDSHIILQPSSIDL